MTDGDGRAVRRRGTRLPATLLAIAVIATAGMALWILLSPLPEAAKTPPAPVASRAEPSPHPVMPAAAPVPHPVHAPPAAPVPAPSEKAASPQPHTAPPPPVEKPPPAPPSVRGPEPGAKQENVPAAAHAPAVHAPEPGPKPETVPSIARPPAAAPEPPAVQKTPEPATPAAKAGPAPPLPSTMPKLPRPAPSAALRQAPDPALIEESRQGPLPIIGPDGREAWRVYARPFNQNDKRPRIAIVLYGIGPSASATRAAIQGLPGSITLAFSPYADNLTNSIAEARVAGHEALLMIPMEPTNYPQFDPGPKGLLTSLKPEKNIARLEWILSRTSGYVGVTSFMGSQFTRAQPHMMIVLQQLKRRGLLYLESQTGAAAQIGEIAKTIQVPYTAAALYIDQRASRPAIDSQLREVELLARKLGQAVAMAYPYPVTLERLSAWSSEVTGRGIVLAPVSALAMHAR